MVKRHTQQRNGDGQKGERSGLTRRTLLQGAAATVPAAGVLASEAQTANADPTARSNAWTVTSPNGAVTATLTHATSNGAVSLTVSRDGTTLMEPSPLGIATFEEDLTTGLSFEGRSTQRVTDRYETHGGDQSEYTYEAIEATFSFVTANGTPLDIQVRASNDGIAYRYQLQGDGDVVITGEASSFRVSEDTTGWLLPYDRGYEDSYEEIWTETSAKTATGAYGFPSLFEVEDGSWLFITEADVDGRYSASHLEVDDANDTGSDEATDDNEDTDYDDDPYLFELEFADTYGLPEYVSAERPLATPWRVALVGSLETIVESDIVAALGQPSQIEDESWIRPGRSAWSWWSDSGSPQSYETQKEYVDYAAEQGWEYSLVDRGWDDEWLPDLVEYATERDVGILVWLPWYYMNAEAEREAILDQMSEWGVAGVKVDYMNSDLQTVMEWYDEALAATAERELMINFHGATVPKGRRRTWPHLMTSEAVHGAEQYKFGEVTPTHNAILPFTRNVVGPMDYTPVTFSASDEPPKTTLGHELALSVVYHSDWQHFADSVETYRSYPLAERVLSTVSAAWDESHFLRGRPGEEATLARRSDREWFVGSIIAGDARTVEIPLSFLSDCRRYDAEITSDSLDDQSTLELDRTTVTNSESLSVSAPENGGFVVRFVPHRD
ncbi:glycoside hydrolase family 97 protein [Haladaptatus sp. DYF46]|uniref:glycoside hydrolase family 97 protein n=1 Tax=Haladaptatus sp. DYF46 TaxID=2886041 RepID=UPI001E40F93F|nr:glycoside hydrolase family 97 protein [Haladaptatus sp. DYF46]